MSCHVRVNFIIKDILFFFAGNLRAHIVRVHTIPSSGEQVYKCMECPCVFKKLGSLNAHMSRMHCGDGVQKVNKLIQHYSAVMIFILSHINIKGKPGKVN